MIGFPFSNLTIHAGFTKIKLIVLLTLPFVLFLSVLTTAKGEENLFDLISSGVSDTSFKEILQKEQNPNKVNSENLSLLHFAVLNGSESHVQILLEAGANPNILDNGFQTPLHYAVIDKQVAIVELLVSAGADVNIQDFIGNTPLDLAYETESDPIIQTLGMNNAYSGQNHFRLWNECQPVNINVLPLTEEAELRGITNSQIEAISWYHLLSNDLFDGELQDNIVEIDVSTFEHDETQFRYSIKLKFYRKVQDINSEITKLVVTWVHTKTGLSPKNNSQDYVLGGLLSSMTVFSDAYLEINKSSCSDLARKDLS